MKPCILLTLFALGALTQGNAQNTFPSTGNVGIGTSAPVTRLHIAGSGSNVDAGNAFIVNGDGLAVQAMTGGRSATMGAQLEFVIPANTDGTNFYGQGRIITVAGNATTGDATGKMIIGTRRYFNKLGAGMQWYYGNDIVIDGSGNVGLGILTPSNRLEVYQSNTLNLSDVTTYGELIAQNGSALGIGGYSSGSSVQSFNSLPLMLNPIGNNVLIGKSTQTNTGYKLDVAGNVRANQVTVNTTGADFVFDPAYALPSLESVGAFVRAHRRLPGIAPAAEMQAEGMSLGETQTQLLQKVEELTLYAIEADKRAEREATLVKKLESRLDALQEEVDRLKAVHSKP